MTQFSNKYNLEDRTAKFGERIIIFCRLLNEDSITRPLINQLIRSATSVGANYREANGASSKKDFQNKIYICKKESKETLYWLELIGKSLDEDKLVNESRSLWSEVKQLMLIFSKIASTAHV